MLILLQNRRMSGGAELSASGRFPEDVLRRFPNNVRERYADQRGGRG